MILAVLFSLAIAGQTPEISRQCRDDNGADRCAAEQRAAVRATLGLAAIEDEAAAGVESYRAFYVDGYGRDMPAVSFERRPGSDPAVVVNGSGGRRMSAPVSSEVWNRVRADARFADRTLEPLPVAPSPDGRPAPPGPICLHSWVTTVEIANSTPDGRKVEPVRRRTETACGGGLTTRFAFSLMDEAIKAIAPCGLVDAAVLQKSILDTCLDLVGDRFAAASLMNRVRTGMPRPNLDVLDPGVWRAYLGTNGSPQLNWNGELVKTDRPRDNKVAEFIVARLHAAPSTRIEPRRFEGLTGRSAVAEGVVSYSTGERATTQRYEAPYRQTWVWDPNLSEWMLDSWTVEAFRPLN